METASAANADVPTGAASRRRPAWHRWAIGIAIVIVIGAAADLLGWNIRGWLHELWKTMTGISAKYVAANIALRVVQTVATAFAWFSILRFAYPETRWRDILAGYAVSVALNSILPANLGTLVMLIMFSILVAASGFAAILGSYAVEKIFFTVAGGFVYAYLFLSVGGSFDIKFDFIHERPVATVVLAAGAVILLVLLVRRFWVHVVKWWGEAKEGGAILAKPRTYLGRVFLPSFVAWVAMLGGNAVLLAAYGIPVTFEILMRVAGGNSLANVTSVTPGGAGVTQVFNVASLKGIASSQDATAFSVTNQLIGTAWNIVFAICLMIWAWGWSGGKDLVASSYQDAKRRQAEQRERKRAKESVA
jgi:uncharacterized membrane protein YbhN (UPF0104 family)